MYNEPKNSPMIPNEQKRIYQKNLPPQPREQQPMVDLKLYQPQPPRGKPTKREPHFLYPYSQVEAGYMPSLYDTAFVDYLRSNYQTVQPYFKNYNINIGDFRGSSHASAMAIIEDVLPLKNVSTTFTTVEDRSILYDYIRSIMFPTGDGEDMNVTNENSTAGTISGGNINTANEVMFSDLLARVKLMDLNPYFGLERNPYAELPSGFFIYRSCYPIKYNSNGPESLICARDSVGVNIRIYRLTEESYATNKVVGSTPDRFNEWRDIAFYSFVKNQMVKQKMSPNFVLLYGYFVALNSEVIYDTIKQTDSYNPAIVEDIPHPAEMTSQQLASYNGKSIIALTEASNYNLLKWASKEYRTDGSIPHMINHGYYPDYIWFSVLFQLMSALHCLQVKQIVIKDFKLSHNVFIKDTNVGGAATHYWKYKINGIDYHIPNHGYVVLIDTNFTDKLKETDSTYHKIDGKIINTTEMTEAQLQKETFEMFKQAMNLSIFDSSEFKMTGTRPPDSVMNLLKNIYDDASSSEDMVIAHYIRKYMTMFLHNRVGTPLTDSEKNNIKLGGLKNFRNGQIVVYTDSDGLDRFAVHVFTNEKISRILTIDTFNQTSSSIIEKEVPLTSLNEYSATEPIRQTFKANINLSDDGLIETYLQ